MNINFKSLKWAPGIKSFHKIYMRFLLLLSLYSALVMPTLYLNKFINSFAQEYLVNSMGAEREMRVVLLNSILKKDSFQKLKAVRIEDDWIRDILRRMARMRRNEKLTQSYRDGEWIRSAVQQKKEMDRVIYSKCSRKWSIVANAFHVKAQEIIFSRLQSVLPGYIQVNDKYKVSVPAEIRRVVGLRKVDYTHYIFLEMDLPGLPPLLSILLQKAMDAWKILCVRSHVTCEYSRTNFMDTLLLTGLLTLDYDELPLVDIISSKLHAINEELKGEKGRPSKIAGKAAAGYLQLMLWAIREKGVEEKDLDRILFLEWEIKQAIGFDMDDLVNLKILL